MRRTFDRDTGYPIRVNLYIIRFLYCHMDSKNEPNLSGEIKKLRPAYNIYDESYYPSRQRIDRINQGKGFEFSNAEANCISRTFGISKEYFTEKAKEPFQIKGITELDWVSFYFKEYELGDERIEGLTEKEIESMHTKVIRALHLIIKKWRNFSSGDPIYLICYYYYYGNPFINKPKQTDMLKSLLVKITYSDWENESSDYLENTYNIMKKHFDYLRHKVELNRLLKLEKKQRGI